MKIKVNSGYIVEDPADSRRCMLIAYNAASDHVYVFRRGEIVFLDLDDPENQPEAAEEKATKTEENKIVCKECNWRGQPDERLVANNPFQLDEHIHGCPKCKGAHCFFTACDEAGCWYPATEGNPTPEGYRSTCFKHRPEAAEAKGGES